MGALVYISGPKLKSLNIFNWDDVGSHEIKISSPKLADLDIGGRICEDNNDSVQFHGNSHFKWAHLYFSIEAIGAACDPALSNLKTLFLRITLEAFTFDELIRILKYCPKLENLTLMIRKDFDEEGVRLGEAETRRL